MADPKKRRYPRFKLSQPRTMTVQGPGRRSAYPCTMIGLGGAFLQSRDPLPKGTPVRFAIKLMGHTLRGAATVRSNTPNGMGLNFMSFLGPEDRLGYTAS